MVGREGGGGGRSGFVRGFWTGVGFTPISDRAGALIGGHAGAQRRSAFRRTP